MPSKNISRRKFIRQSALATAGAAFIPSFLKAFDRVGGLAPGQKRLVIIQLGGGNDGLNTVVPFGDDLYYKARPQIGISTSEVIRLNHHQGIHPALEPLRALYDQGDVAILNAVGYPNPNRSHFRSMDIWNSGSASNEYLQTGWIGRYLDAHCADDPRPTAAIQVSDQLGLAMKGKERTGLAVSDPQRFYKTAAAPRFKALAEHAPEDHGHSEVGYLYKTLAESISSAEYIFEKTKVQQASGDYPQGPLARQLRNTARMIKSGLDTRIFYTNAGGFDTHVNQPAQHQRLLGGYAGAVAAFAKDLKASGHWKDTVVMTFSEFGRRVKENASRGTDHGTANNLFLMGGSLKQAGLCNAAPKLDDLDKGDLKYQVDFRQVYAEVLQKWLQVDPQPIMGTSFAPLGIL